MSATNLAEEEHLSRFERFEEWYFSKSRLWMAMGVGILVVVWVLTGFRDVNEATLTNLFLTGVQSGATYQGAVTAERLLQHSTEQSLLLAMSFFKLAIGGYIYVIVRNLEKTSRHARSKLNPDIGPAPKPFFRKLFPRLLVLGTDIQLVNVGIMMVLWDVNALNLLHLQFLGQTSGAAFSQASTIDSFIGTLVNPVEMLGASFMLAGIPLGLASIVYNLRMQLRMLPTLIGSYIVNNLKVPLPNYPAPTALEAVGGTTRVGLVPRKTLAATMTGLLIGISGLLVISPVRTLDFFHYLSLGTNFQMLASVTSMMWLFLGLGLLVFSVNLWLRHITRALEETRIMFGKILTTTTGTLITPVQRELWPYRAALPFAVAGLVAYIANFGIALYIDSMINAASSAAASGSVAGAQQAMITLGMVMPLAGTLPFFGFGLLLAGIGLYLVAIIINLRQTASTLLNVFPRMTTYCATGGKSASSDSVALAPSMSFAPWKSISVIFIGAAVGMVSFFPLAYLDALNVASYMTLGNAGYFSSSAYSASLFASRIFDHTLLPLKLAGLGIMLLGVGRTFGVIVGFVKARTVVIREFIDSITSLNPVQAPLLAAKTPGSPSK